MTYANYSKLSIFNRPCLSSVSGVTSIMEELINRQIVINITSDQLKNKSKKQEIRSDAFKAAIACLNGYYARRLVLRSETHFSPAEADDLARPIQQSLTHIVGVVSFGRYFEIRFKEQEGKTTEIVFLVAPKGRLSTVKYNLYLPLTTMVKQVPVTDQMEEIAALLNVGWLDSRSLQSYVRKFQMDKKAPGGLRESETVQFKKVRFDRTKNKSTAERIISNNITHYVSAFANKEGGHVYVGIDDETSLVCGQTVVNKEEEKEISERIELAITNMVWPDEHGNPERGKHWDIAFVPVRGEADEEIPGLFVIVISVARCPGGVFLAAPESYVLRDVEGELEVRKMTFRQWKIRFLHDANVQFRRERFPRKNAWNEANAFREL